MVLRENIVLFSHFYLMYFWTVHGSTLINNKNKIFWNADQTRWSKMMNKIPSRCLEEISINIWLESRKYKRILANDMWKRTANVPWCLLVWCPCWHHKQLPDLHSYPALHSCHMFSVDLLLDRNKPTPGKKKEFERVLTNTQNCRNAFTSTKRVTLNVISVLSPHPPKGEVRVLWFYFLSTWPISMKLSGKSKVDQNWS